PQVPTMAEAGFSGVESLSWGGLFAPARTPPDIVQRLSDAATEALNSPQVKAALDAVASFTINMPHVPFQDYVNREAGKWSEVLRKAGVQPE
ncbi:MAG: tripartite tricarboxylate transporter substrate binding protein, partial [Comamonadaceae bacterium]